MNHRHRKILHTVFAHPINNNLAMRDVSSVLGELGGEINETSRGKIHVVLNGNAETFAHPGHSMPKEEVIKARKFIESCGITLEDYPL